MKSPARFFRTNSRTATAALFGLALILVTACGLTGAAPTPTPTCPPAHPPTVVPVPSATPTATAPAPPAQPTPVATPLPTPVAARPTPAPGADDKVEYVTALSDIACRWETWSAAADALMSEVGQDPLAVCITRSGDIDAQIAGGRELLAALSAAPPPEEIAAEHQRLVDEGSAGLDALEAGKTALCRRLDTTTALTKMDEVNAHLVNAYAAAEALFAWMGAQ